MPRKPLDALEGPHACEQLPGKHLFIPGGCLAASAGSGAEPQGRLPSPLLTIAVGEHQNIKSGDHTHSMPVKVVGG
jgi:hypothetical protein